MDCNIYATIKPNPKYRKKESVPNINIPNTNNKAINSNEHQKETSKYSPSYGDLVKDPDSVFGEGTHILSSCNDYRHSSKVQGSIPGNRGCISTYCSESSNSLTCPETSSTDSTDSAISSPGESLKAVYQVISMMY